ncbi:hypothetical protein [Thalassorhabdomicrobium marinisediminis]|uniref:Uncharacterized protein n=1 Tax=Thalassorhabdomicrobium marinisediminis TaxID=2170577 RepID=A0A2T7G191_9RHOB|nr:hypothetical protein [Thalassorhabdomicrobium marinisediminis]PVA08179.1 hypothetical protein DC363_01395 [Thalassorhabdomicrobium marinisediminis]
MKPGVIIGVIVVIVLAIFAFYMIDIDQTQEGSMPEVSVEGGEMPEFDADVGDVSVEEETITVPTLEVTPPEDDADETTE